MLFTFLSYRIDSSTNERPVYCMNCGNKISCGEGFHARRRTSRYGSGHLCLTCLYEYVDGSKFWFGEGLPFEGVKERGIEIKPLYTKDQVKELLVSEPGENA